MAYDVKLANRIRDVVSGELGISEEPMFGGLAFFINGNLAVSANSQGGLLVRIDPTQTDHLVREPQVRRFEMRGRKMDGWLGVAVEAVEADDSLREWVHRGVAFARSLPPK